MDLFTLNALFSSSVLIGGVLAVVRFPQIRKIYYPFIFLIWLACINETLGYLIAMNGGDTLFNNILYDLMESLLLIWFFRNLGIFKKREMLFYSLITLFVLFWGAESFYTGQFAEKFNSYFSIVYSLIIVLLSITAINQLLFEEKEVARHPTFLICMATVIFFTYKIAVEMFAVFGVEESKSFQVNVYIILMIINFLCNLIYALAILWMRRKQAFTLQF